MSTPSPPVVTVVIVTYGRGDLAAHCLDVLAEHTRVPYEVVVVDSGSPDGTGEWLRHNLSGLLNVTVLCMPRNLGFGAGCELGIQRARGEFICLLNADVEVTPGWLDPLLELLRYNDNAAAVAPAMVFPNGRLQEAGSLMGGEGLSRGWGDGAEYGGSGAGYDLYPRVVDYASAACLLLRRNAFYAAGGFCSEYHIAYYEDADLQFALRSQGWQIWVQPESRVVHARHGTSSTSTAERLSAVNRKIFRRRWAEQLAARPPSVDAPAHPHRLHWLRDAASSFSVLLLVNRVPEDDRDLAAVRAWRAADPAASVTLLAARGPGSAALRSAGIEVVSEVDDLDEWGPAHAGLYDVVVTFGERAHGELGAVLDSQPQAVRVFDLDVLRHAEYEHRFRTAHGARRREFGVLAGIARRRVTEAVDGAEVVVCSGERETAWARGITDVPVYTANAHDYPDVLDSVLVECALPPRVIYSA